MVTHPSGSFFIDTNNVETMLEWLDDAGFEAQVRSEGSGTWAFYLSVHGGFEVHRATGACLRDGVRDMLSAALSHQQHRSA